MQFSEDLSSRAQRVVSGYVTTMGYNNDGYLKLLVSLYAQRSQAKRDVLSPLKDYVDDFSETLSAEELIILLGEFKTVMAYCFSELTDARNHGLPSEFDSGVPNYLFELGNRMTSPISGSDILLANVSMGMLPFLDKKHNYNGYECSAKRWAITQIYYDVFDIPADIKNCCFDETTNELEKQYDYIYYLYSDGLRPFGFPSDSEKSLRELIALSRDFLKDEGRMFCILPKNFTSGSSWEKLREIFVDSQYGFEMEVISFNDCTNDNYKQLFHKHIWPSCILNIKKAHVAKITLVEAGKDGLEKEINTTFSSSRAETILTAIKANDKRYIWHGAPSDLLQNHNLNPAIYLMESHVPIPSEGERLMEIGELVDIVPHPIYPYHGQGWEGPTIKEKDLSTNYLNRDINMDEVYSFWSRYVYLLSEDALLFCFERGKAKIAKFTYSGQETGMLSHIIPFKIKSTEMITEDFLLSSLMLKETLKQVSIYAGNNEYGTFSESDFMRLKIIVPSVKKQLESCLFQSRESLSMAYKKLHEEQENFRRDILMKKHAIGQTMFSLSSWWDLLQIIRKDRKDGAIDDNTMIGNSSQMRVAEIYNNIQINMERIEHQIDSFDRGFSMVPEKIELFDFIVNYTEQHKSPVFEYRSEALKAASVYRGEVFIIFPREALTIIFNNIVNNACEHGFADCEMGNIIKIELYQENGKVVVTIANNGQPMNPQLSERDFFTYGRTSQEGNNHMGLGGYEINRLMQEFGGDVELVLSSDEEFPVLIKLAFDMVKDEVIPTHVSGK